jgi:hypothetical protein
VLRASGLVLICVAACTKCGSTSNETRARVQCFKVSFVPCLDSTGSNLTCIYGLQNESCLLHCKGITQLHVGKGQAGLTHVGYTDEAGFLDSYYFCEV